VRAKKDRPWLTGSGVEIPTIELKEICKTWAPEQWDSYLKWYASGARELLVSPTTYSRICEERTDSIFESQKASVTPAKQNLVGRLLGQLPEREAHILRSTFIDGRTQVDIAADFPLSRQRITQLKRNAFLRLKRGLAGDKLAARQFMRGVSNSGEQIETSIWDMPMVPPPREDRKYQPGNFEIEMSNLKNHSFREAHRRLPKMAREIMYLRFWCDLSVREIARRLSMGGNVVEQIIEASVSKVIRTQI
jgi:DNA-directed RNA polymerase specialized sigma subunit